MAFSNFIWGHQRPRLLRIILSLLKSKGSAGVPDLSLYHATAVLTRMVKWFYHSLTKQWVYIEQTITPCDL